LIIRVHAQQDVDDFPAVTKNSLLVEHPEEKRMMSFDNQNIPYGRSSDSETKKSQNRRKVPTFTAKLNIFLKIYS
jgi:hypothetical protein